MPIIYEKVAEGIIAVSDPEADMRRTRAWANIAELGALRTITADEARDYIVNQVVGTTTQDDAWAAVDNATTLAQLKIVLKALIESIYSIVDILVLMAQLLIALRDYVKPEIVDE